MPKLDHIAIFVTDLDAGLAFYGEVLGLGEAIIKHVPELNIRCAFFVGADGTIIELVSFTGSGELAHGDVVVALEVDNLDVALTEYRAKGLRVFDQPPTENLPLRRGWITKASGHGTIIELCQPGEVAAYVRSATGNV
jgi:catechol 2,3-dioxygenase-like lactoylglutathione lyase family enzyme